MYTNKGFTGNDGNDEPDWDAREVQHFQDLENTLATDTLEGLNQPVGGHQHIKICHDRSSVGVDSSGYVNIVPAVYTSSPGDVKIDTYGGTGKIYLNPKDITSSIHAVTISAPDTGSVKIEALNTDNFTISANNFLFNCYSDSSHGVTLSVVSQNYLTIAPYSNADPLYVQAPSNVLGLNAETVNAEASKVSNGSLLISIQASDSDNGDHNLTLNTESGGFVKIDSGSDCLSLIATKFKMTGMSTSSSGLTTGMLWHDSSGNIKIII